MSDDASSTSSTEGQEPHGDGQEQQTTEPTIESLAAQIEDLKANSRKWEDRAKANKGKADQFDALQRESMTDAEKAEATLTEAQQRVTDAEQRATAAEAALARLQIVHEFGLDADDTDALEGITDADALRKVAERLAAGRSGSTPRPRPTQGQQRTAPQSKGEQFAAALEGLL